MVMRALGVVGATLVLLGACGGSEDKTKTSTGARASCAQDADCVVTDTINCCAACKMAPLAIPKLSFEQNENKCSVVDCSARSERVECPQVASKDGFVAKCNDGTCAAVKR